MIIEHNSNGHYNILEELEEPRVCYTLYEGGIYWHQGCTFLINKVHLHKKGQKFASVFRVNSTWSTRAR